MDNYLLVLIVFVGVTALSFVIQAAILGGLYSAVKKISARVEDLANKVEGEAMPALASARDLLAETKPKISKIVDNLETTTTTVRTQAERASLTMNDVLDRTRLQVIRADELMTRTLDRVEQTTEMVHHTVLSPVHKMSALMDGVLAGVGTFMGQRKVKRQSKAVPQDEMFI